MSFTWVVIHELLLRCKRLRIAHVHELASSRAAAVVVVVAAVVYLPVSCLFVACLYSFHSSSLCFGDQSSRMC